MSLLTICVSNIGPAYILECVYEEAKLHDVKVECTLDHGRYFFVFTCNNTYSFICFLPYLYVLGSFCSEEVIQSSFQ